MMKENLDDETIELSRDEIAILAILDHPNIVKYIESYEDNRYMYIVQEYLKNSTELFEIIAKQGKMTQGDHSKDNEPLFPQD